MARGSAWLKRAVTGACVALLVIILSGCSIFGGGPQSVNHPAGDNMRDIWNLFVPIFWMSVVVFVIVQGVLLYSVIKFRRKPGSPEPHPTHGNTKLEITWTIIPALILAVITVPTIAKISEFAKRPNNAITVQVVGHQWWWEFDYPGENVVVADEMHIPIGVPIEVELRSDDVIHSFWIPKLAGKQDVVPNQHNHFSFTAEEIGTFRGQCAEFCGDQHANMAFTVVVQSQQDYDAWLAHNKMPAVDIPSSDQLAKQGQQVFFTAGCVGCHTIEGMEVNGVKALGDVGPNLTHVGSRTAIAGEVLPLTQENLAKWVHNPQAVKPGTLMPNLGLTQEQANQVAAFLEALK
jgi:cytochrome c oxidase subunit 2